MVKTTVENDTIRLVADYINLVKLTYRSHSKEVTEFGASLVSDKAEQLLNAGLTIDQINLIGKAVRL